MIPDQHSKSLTILANFLFGSGFVAWLTVDLAHWNDRLEIILRILSIISITFGLIIAYFKIKKHIREEKSAKNGSNSKT